MVIKRTAALRASEARFRTIFENSTIGIALLNSEGQILAANPTLQTLLGYSDDELANTSFASYYADGADTSDSYASTSDGRELDYGRAERRYISKDGQKRWSEITLSRVKSTKRDTPQLAIAMVQDITEERQNRQALLQAERLTVVGRLGASLAHEINNPLQVVIGCLGLADEMLGEAAPARGYLEIAVDEVERVSDIVGYLRDLGRDPVEAQAEFTDVNGLIERTLFLTEQRCQDGGVKVHWSPVAGLPPISLVSDRIQHVFLNIILNALEAMPEGGRLSIRTALTDQPNGIDISFADTGAGIAFDDLSSVFEPFNSTRSQGMGLGLYISRNIIETHRGKIEASSQGDRGTTFTVWLPL